MKRVPKNKVCEVVDVNPGSMNCGKKAKKKIGSLGFSIFMKIPCQKIDVFDFSFSLTGVTICSLLTSVRIARYIRYAAPVNFTTVKAIADVFKITANPNAAQKR